MLLDAGKYIDRDQLLAAHKYHATLGLMSGLSRPPQPQTPADDETIAGIESALHGLARRLKQARLHDFVLKQAGVDIDQAGLAILYALHAEKASLRVTDLAERLGIDAPAVTRKAQRLERLGLVRRSRDADDARASLLRLSPQGQEAIERFLLARHQWLTMLLADWPPAERCEFARLLTRFADGICHHLDDLDS
jgi:DNA-binding MarR family transcriptional regulator